MKRYMHNAFERNGQLNQCELVCRKSLCVGHYTRQSTIEKVRLKILIMDKVPVKHADLGKRSDTTDMSTLVELTPFDEGIQPFLVTIFPNAALVINLHCHLTDESVCGYLGGHWDNNEHHVHVLKAYPCRYSKDKNTTEDEVEDQILSMMKSEYMNIVGRYHSHPRTYACPSLHEVDAQLEDQIKMKTPTGNSYIPNIGIICSPHHTKSNLNLFWSMPPDNSDEYPKPMLLNYTILPPEKHISRGVLKEITKCIDYYKNEGGIDFISKFGDNTTYLDKLKKSLASVLPEQNSTNDSYWDWIKKMIESNDLDNSFNFVKTYKR